MYVDLVLREHLLLLSRLKTVVLINIFVNTVINTPPPPQDYLMNYKAKNYSNYMKNTLNFDQFNVPLLNKTNWYTNHMHRYAVHAKFQQ